ncbi:hypothetical protein NDU88_000300 [Pleurodeles waltl]|uniref:Uncharacterized protein n=1 Tax=Pleurodeles waltl TaxID=8319 RepID=A0AAV7U481_PLEWA|nr:hypothetical protein NDU88_000300 [Pleurodeles waltl]
MGARERGGACDAPLERILLSHACMPGAPPVPAVGSALVSEDLDPSSEHERREEKGPRGGRDRWAHSSKGRARG